MEVASCSLVVARATRCFFTAKKTSDKKGFLAGLCGSRSPSDHCCSGESGHLMRRSARSLEGMLCIFPSSTYSSCWSLAKG